MGWLSPNLLIFGQIFEGKAGTHTGCPRKIIEISSHIFFPRADNTQPRGSLKTFENMGRTHLGGL